MNAKLIDPSLPVADAVTGREIFTVEYRNTDRRETCRVEFEHELNAVRAIGAYELYVNTEVLGYGPNIDRSKYRH